MGYILSPLVNDSGRNKRRRVLVVDDEPSVRTFVERALTGAGFDVVLAANGPEALTIAEQQRRFDLCIVDMVMPRMSGDEVARQLRRADPDVKILYFTGYSDRLFAESMTLGANEAFLDKPTSVKGMLEAISLLLFGKLPR